MDGAIFSRIQFTYYIIHMNLLLLLLIYQIFGYHQEGSVVEKVETEAYL